MPIRDVSTTEAKVNSLHYRTRSQAQEDELTARWGQGARPRKMNSLQYRTRRQAQAGELAALWGQGARPRKVNSLHCRTRSQAQAGEATRELESQILPLRALLSPRQYHNMPQNS